MDGWVLIVLDVVVVFVLVLVVVYFLYGDLYGLGG